MDQPISRESCWVQRAVAADIQKRCPVSQMCMCWLQSLVYLARQLTMLNGVRFNDLPNSTGSRISATYICTTAGPRT